MYGPNEAGARAEGALGVGRDSSSDAGGVRGRSRPDAIAADSGTAPGPVHDAGRPPTASGRGVVSRPGHDPLRAGIGVEMPGSHGARSYGRQW